MTRRFQMVLVFDGGLVTPIVQADLERNARSLFSGERFVVLECRDLGAVLHPGQFWFRAEEAAAYLGIKVSKLYELMGEGRLKRAKNGDPLFSREQLDRVAAEGMGAKKEEDSKTISLKEAA